MMKALNARVSMDDFLLIARIQVELRVHLRREPTLGDIVSALLAHTRDSVAPGQSAPAAVMAAALAPLVRS